MKNSKLRTVWDYIKNVSINALEFTKLLPNEIMRLDSSHHLIQSRLDIFIPKRLRLWMVKLHLLWVVKALVQNRTWRYIWRFTKVFSWIIYGASHIFWVSPTVMFWPSLLFAFDLFLIDWAFRGWDHVIIIILFLIWFEAFMHVI